MMNKTNETIANLLKSKTWEQIDPLLFSVDEWMQFANYIRLQSFTGVELANKIQCLLTRANLLTDDEFMDRLEGGHKYKTWGKPQIEEFDVINRGKQMSTDIEKIKQAHQAELAELELCKQVFPQAEWSGRKSEYWGYFEEGPIKISLRIYGVSATDWTSGVAIEGHLQYLFKADSQESALGYVKDRLEQLITAVSVLTGKSGKQ